MLVRFALAAGHGCHRHALRTQASRAGLTETIERPNFFLAAEADTPVLADQDTIVVGEIFSGTGQRLNVLPQPAHPGDRAISRLDGCWGNFICFSSAGGQPVAYRDPSGNMPLYRLEALGGAIFVSDAETAQGLGLFEAASIDRHFLVHWLQYPFLRTRRTGIDTALEVLPGTVEIQERGGAWANDPVWTPAGLLRHERAIFDPAEAAARLRTIALASVRSQVPPGAVLRLSGGLDSSILAACLAGGGNRLPCINFATGSADGDERDYARMTAFALGLELHETAGIELVRLESPARVGFQPSTNPLLLPFERSLDAAAMRLGAKLLVDGSGGDNLFFYTNSAAPLIDSLRFMRLEQAAATLIDLANFADCTLWDVLRAAARRALRPSIGWTEDRSFLNPAICLPRADLHPWLSGLRKLPPGKRDHIVALVHIHHFLDRGAGDLPVLHPLMARPLMEVCLRIPSWLWVRGGRDRAIARDAFQGLLPKPVLDRRDKGSMQSIFHRSFERLRDEMRDLLMTGQLRALGVLDEAALDSAFEDEISTNDTIQLRITELVTLELWLSAWGSRGIRAIAP